LIAFWTSSTEKAIPKFEVVLLSQPPKADEIDVID
jgi:hypothetical protein